MLQLIILSLSNALVFSSHLILVGLLVFTYSVPKLYPHLPSATSVLMPPPDGSVDDALLEKTQAFALIENLFSKVEFISILPPFSF